MEQRNKQRRTPNRRGVTIAETVIAMAIILAVSLAAITVIRRVSVTTTEDQYHREAINIAENARQCLIFADTVEEFASSFGSVLKAQDGDLIEVDPTAKSYFMMLVRDGYEITMRVDYGARVPQMHISGTALLSNARASRKPLFSFTYEKYSQEGVPSA